MMNRSFITLAALLSFDTWVETAVNSYNHKEFGSKYFYFVITNFSTFFNYRVMEEAKKCMQCDLEIQLTAMAPR